MSKKSGPPKHVNTEAWVPKRADKHNSGQQLINKLPLTDGVCKKCAEVIDWKKRYGKYKTLKHPSKCLGCGQKNCFLAYHQLCRGCADKRRVCAKCMSESASSMHSQGGVTQEEIDDLLGSLNERQRRSALRKFERGEAEGKSRTEIMNELLAKADGKSESKSESTSESKGASESKGDDASSPVDAVGASATTASAGLSSATDKLQQPEDKLQQPEVEEEHVDVQLDELLERARALGLLSEVEADELTDAQRGSSAEELIEAWGDRIAGVAHALLSDEQAPSKGT